MHVRWTERIFSALLPVILALSSFRYPLLVIFLPAGFYYISRRAGLSFSADHALRLFDLLISIFVKVFLLGILMAAIDTVLRDGGYVALTGVSNLVSMVLLFILFAYLALALFLHLVFSLLGREFRMPFALRPFEALRGRRLSADNQCGTHD